MKVPAWVGVPLIVILSLAHDALTPGGNLLAPETPPFTMPVAPVVVWVIFVVNPVLIHIVGVPEANPAVMAGLTVMVPVAFTLPHPPLSGML